MPRPNPALLAVPSWLIDLRPPQHTPWAILLCAFKDTVGPSPTPRPLYDRLFTTAGANTFNAIQYFLDVSHGMLDLSGSQVFDSLTIDANLNDYTAPSDPPPPGWMPGITRADLTRKAREAAIAAGVPLQNFWGDVIIFNVAIGIPFGMGGIPYSASAGNRPYACGDYRSISTAIYSHEMGHAYGLNHSREDGSTDDYRDPWDIMSALVTYISADPDYTNRGPGLNAANMRALGWWNERRVWRPSSAPFGAVIELRPLHRRDLPGLLAAELSMQPGGFTVEYRKRDRWDGGAPRSAVFVHRYRLGNSYVMKGISGRRDLIKGDKFQSYSGPLPYVSSVEVEVMNIDDPNDVATVRVSSTAAERPPAATPVQVFGQVPFDGGGGVLINGRFVPIPPWNPMAAVLQLIAELPDRDDATQTYLRNALARNVLTGIQGRVQAMIDEIDSFGGPDRRSRPFELPTAERRKPARRIKTKPRRR